MPPILITDSFCVSPFLLNCCMVLSCSALPYQTTWVFSFAPPFPAGQILCFSISWRAARGLRMLRSDPAACYPFPTRRHHPSLVHTCLHSSRASCTRSPCHAPSPCLPSARRRAPMTLSTYPPPPCPACLYLLKPPRLRRTLVHHAPAFLPLSFNIHPCLRCCFFRLCLSCLPCFIPPVLEQPKHRLGKQAVPSVNSPPVFVQF